MWRWISKSALPAPDVADWIFAVYAWLLVHTGGFASFANRSLVLPTDEYFPVASTLKGHDLALALFERTISLAGLKDWPCRLVAQDEDVTLSDLMGAVPQLRSSCNGTAGTFSIGRDRRVEISYSARILESPGQFVATIAHELAHYLMATISTAPPGGSNAEEPATDVCAVFLGFGVFAANAAFSFRQFQSGNRSGWESSHMGYLDERGLAYALAVFLELRGLDTELLRTHLDPNPRTYLKHAIRDLQRNRREDLDELRAIRQAIDTGAAGAIKR